MNDIISQIKCDCGHFADEHSSERCQLCKCRLSKGFVLKLDRLGRINSKFTIPAWIFTPIATALFVAYWMVEGWTDTHTIMALVLGGIGALWIPSLVRRIKKVQKI